MSKRITLLCVAAVVFAAVASLGWQKNATRKMSTPTWSSTWAESWSDKTKQNRLFVLPPIGRGPTGLKPTPRAAPVANLRDEVGTAPALKRKGPWKPPPPPVSKPGPAKLAFAPPAKYFYGRVAISMYPSELPEEEEVLDPSYPDGQSSVAAVQLTLEDGDPGFIIGEARGGEVAGRHVVLGVEPGSPAAKAGIQEGDLLRALTCYTSGKEETKSVNLLFWSAQYTNKVDVIEHGYMVTDKLPQWTVNSALASNVGPGIVNLVFERRFDVLSI